MEWSEIKGWTPPEQPPLLRKLLFHFYSKKLSNLNETTSRNFKSIYRLFFESCDYKLLKDLLPKLFKLQKVDIKFGSSANGPWVIAKSSFVYKWPLSSYRLDFKPFFLLLGIKIYKKYFLVSTWMVRGTYLQNFKVTATMVLKVSRSVNLYIRGCVSIHKVQWGW